MSGEISRIVAPSHAKMIVILRIKFNRTQVFWYTGNHVQRVAYPLEEICTERELLDVMEERDSEREKKGQDGETEKKERENQRKPEKERKTETRESEREKTEKEKGRKEKKIKSERAEGAASFAC